jgi:hypothetical protein
MEMIKVSGSASVPGGPAVGFSKTIPLSSYTKYKKIAPASDNVEFETAGSNLRLLLVRASDYTKLGVTVNAEVAADQKPLEDPLLIAGEGALERFAGGTLDKLVFHNGHTEDITVEVFIGRA